MIFIDLEPLFQAENEFERAITRFDERVRLGVQRAVQEGAEEAIRTHKYKDDTGLLTSRIRGYIEISTPGGAVGVIAALTDYASYVEGGTKPHEIRGNPLLVFKGRDGQWVRTTLVHHPGHPPFPFMAQAFFKAERVLLREAEMAAAELQEFLDS